MKVLHLNNYYSGGGAETVFHLTRKNLPEMENFSGYIWKEGDKEKPDIIFKSWETDNRIVGSIDFVFSTKNYKLLLNFLNKHDIDIIHIHAFMSPLSPSILSAIKKIKKKRNMKVIETLHGFHMICPNMSLFNYKKNVLCEKCVSKKYKLTILRDNCDGRGYFFSLLKSIKSIIDNNIINHRNVIDLFIAPSEFLRQKFIEDGINANKISLIRNPFIIGNDEIEIKKENVVCYFGRFSREKNLEFLINAFCKWKDKTTNNFKLLLIGEGEEEKKLKSLANTSEHKGDVIFKNYMPHNELFKVIKNSKYFCMTSKWYENAPVSILEALSLSIIPIVPNIGGMDESVNSIVKIGRTYSSGDINSWIQNMDWLEKNYLSEFERVKNIKDTVAKEYSLGNYLLRLKHVYGEPKISI